MDNLLLVAENIVGDHPCRAEPRVVKRYKNFSSYLQSQGKSYAKRLNIMVTLKRKNNSYYRDKL